MQRNIDDKKNIIYFFLFLLSIIYETLTTIYPYLPPLMALVFWIFLFAWKNNNKTLLTFVILYTLFFEVDHSLPLFSTLLLFVLLKDFFYKLFKLFSDMKVLKISAVIAVYGLYPVLIYILHKLFKIEYFQIDIYFIGYILVEIFILLILG